MIRPTFVCGLVAIAVVVTALAEDFPLTFRTIPAKDVMAFSGGYGITAPLRLAKPAKLTREPEAVSRHPLYGECGFVFRLDESKGDGKGYDRLIMDMNQNGDLTDDAPAPLVVFPTERKLPSQATGPRLFGPIQALTGTQALAGNTIAGGRPVYYAQAFLNNLTATLRSGQVAEGAYLGQLQLKAGWYVEAAVELKGLKQKVGVFDGDSNLRLGDVSKPQTYRATGADESWYFGQADSLLVDADGSGAFEGDTFESESCPFGPVLYFGATPYQITLSPDFRSLRVEPWTEALAEVALQPHGEQVRSVTLAWERPNKQWQLIRAGVAEGKIQVPPGNYRLYSCVLLGKGAPRDQVMTSAYQRVPKTRLTFAAGKENTLRCGAPLELKVKAQKRRPELWEVNSGELAKPLLVSDSEFVLSISANILGVDGEVYSEYAKGEKFKAEPPQPTFTILDGSGKKVADGKLEFG